MQTSADASDAGPDPQRLLVLLRDGDLDAAIEAGLMRFRRADVAAAIGADDAATILAAQQRLQIAWQARERHRARDARLARIAQQRAARRTPPPAATTSRPPLPAAAATALARARARAAAGDKA